MNKDRYWEIDTLRSIGLVFIIIFHTVFDLNYFGDHNIYLRGGIWWFLGRTGAVIFIFLVGLSLTLSYNRKKKEVNDDRLFPKYLKRGLKIFFLGMLITGFTWLLVRDGFIIFGILHLIGVSVILAYPFLEYRYLNLLPGLLFLILGFVLMDMYFQFGWLFWLGFRPEGFYTLDYFPLLPWFGLVLIGIFFGNLLYPGYQRRFEIPDLSDNKIIEGLSFLGRNTLVIYLLHQPVIIAILYSLGLIDLPFL
ncbi:MAG: DUF1624 domain-containing protein [Candidatus Thermoplasmatota archaeon]|nr:DUF1624 domain-containing protein [Candidatus Thermoplasmatota archaeon]